VAGLGVLARSAARRPGGRRVSLRVVGGLALLASIAVVTLVPVLFVVLGSFDVEQSGNPSSYSLKAWRESLLASPRTQNAIFYSLLLALRAPVAAIAAFFLAWLIIRTRLPGRAFIEFSFWVAFFLPILPVTLGWILVLDPNYGLLNVALGAIPFLPRPLFNVYSVSGILWVHVTATTVPVMIILLGPALRQLDASLEDSARVCGSSPLQIFRRISLPILAPAVLTAALAGFIRSLEAFEVEQILGRPAGIHVYSTRIYDLITWEPPLFPEAMALSSFMLGILIVIALVYQRFSQGRSYATITGRGVSFRPLNTGPWRYFVAAFLFAVTGVVVYVPLAMLISGSFMKLFGFFLADSFTLLHWEQVLRDPVFLLSLRNSLVISLGTASIGVLLYSALAHALVRSRLFARNLTDVLVWLPWTIPGILLGIGLLWLVLSNPVLGLLYGSIILLVLVLVIKDLPIGTHMMKTSISQIALELEQSSHVCGAGWLTTFRRIDLPLMRPMLVSIFVLTFISALRDISTTILLVSASTRPLSILMLEYASSSARESAAVVGVIIAAAAVLVALLARRLGLQVAQGYESG
jgi:iron(III) transport system permease protein